MKTSLQESMAHGIVAAFVDGEGRTVGEAVLTDWQDQPVPARGDHFACPLADGQRRLHGRVVQRQIDVQAQADGRKSVWVQLIVQVEPPQHTPARRGTAGKILFSNN